MARQRFSDLEDVFDELSTASFDITQLPANAKFRKYYEWKTDPTKRETGTRDAASLPGKEITAYIKPFGFPFAADTGYKIGISTRSKERGDTVGATLFDYVTEAPANVELVPNFIPAKTVLSLKLATPGTARRSKITGKSYRPRTGGTWTIPYGRGDANDTEFGKQTEIADAVKATYSYTFKPEQLRRD